MPVDRTLDLMTEELSTSYEIISSLLSFGELLATAPSFELFAKEALLQLSRIIDANVCDVRLHQESRNVLLSACCLGDFDERVTQEISANRMTQAGIAFCEKKEILIESCDTIPSNDPIYSQELRAVICPFFFRDKSLGVLTVARTVQRPVFSSGELQLIRAVADFLGIAQMNTYLQQLREKEQRTIQEFAIAAKIHRALMPQHFASTDRYRTYGMCHSARQIGGDYLDIIPLPDDNLLLVMVDVMGKGLPAALLATTFRGALYAKLQLASQPTQLFKEINRQLSNDLEPLNMFITAQVVFIDCAKKSFTFANAGHGPVLYHHENVVTELTADGIPIGIQRDSDYEMQTRSLHSGDKLLLLTDGLYEAHNQSHQPLKWEGLLDVLKPLWIHPPQQLCQGLVERIAGFCEGHEQQDDQTLLAFECL